MKKKPEATAVSMASIKDTRFAAYARANLKAMGLFGTPHYRRALEREVRFWRLLPDHVRAVILCPEVPS